MSFQQDEPLQVVAGRFDVQREAGVHDFHTVHQLAAIGARSPNICSTRARLGDLAVAPLLRGQNTFDGMAATLGMNFTARLFQRVFTLGAGVAPVGVRHFAGVARIEQSLQYGGVGRSGVGDGRWSCSISEFTGGGRRAVGF